VAAWLLGASAGTEDGMPTVSLIGEGMSAEFPLNRPM
jgi:hypothetical protein